jgi:hypothetical protein
LAARFLAELEGLAQVSPPVEVGMAQFVLADEVETRGG